MPISEIAETLGFNSTWYFAHFFSKRTRTSPASYRKKHGKILSLST
jgi:AraC-like DNA-binding protein